MTLRRLGMGDAGDSYVLPENVIAFPQTRSFSKFQRILYLSHSPSCSQTLKLAFPHHRLEELSTVFSLEEKLQSDSVSLIIFEIDSVWQDPVTLIQEVKSLTDAPVILILNNLAPEMSSRLVKRAYEVGIHDLVRSPVDEDELVESVQVLLKSRCHSFDSSG